MTLSVISNPITPQSKAWRAFMAVALPDEKAAVMDLVSQMYADKYVEEGATLYGLSRMTYSDFCKKHGVPATDVKIADVSKRALRYAGLSFTPRAAKVA